MAEWRFIVKFIHLSDLHIGKRVNEFSMLEDQKYILNKIVNDIEKSGADAVIIAGDVYDKTVPSAEAVQLFDEFLTKLADMDIYVFVISGNHDSAERLAFVQKLLRKQKVYISPVFDGDIFPVKVTDAYGEINVYMLPFVKPAHVKRVYPECLLERYSDAVKYVIDKMNINTQCRNILIAHQLVTGAGRCDSEDISVGGIDNVDVEVFDKFDYVALGHIHSPQSIVKDCIRYCGTPLKYSFSEMNHVKTMTVIDIKEKGNIEIDTSNVLYPLRDMHEIRGKYMDITDRRFYKDIKTDDYFHIILEDENDIPDALGRLRSIYPNIMRMDYDNERTRKNEIIDSDIDMEIKTPLEMFEEFYKLQNNVQMSENQRKIVKDIIDRLMEEEGV